MSSLRKTAAMTDDRAQSLKIGTSAETAEYIEDMARQLERLAAGSDLTRLAGLLAQARKEARRNAFG